MSIFNDIRTALETAVSSVSGIPSADNRAWENVDFKPTTGTTWVRSTLLPGEQRPAVRGPNPQIEYRGLFRIDIFAPKDEGAGDADTLADNIRVQFPPGSDFTNNGKTVRIRWSERGVADVDPPWYRVPVTISWYIFA